MNYYLVDYENVKSHGLDGIVKMSENDVVSIFYSENADTMTFSLHQKLNETRAHVIYEKVEVGTKNALDFQLVTELGYLIRDMQDQEVSFFIVSKDKGYGNTVTYWKKRGVRINQVVDVSGLDEEKIENDLKMRVEPLVRDKEVVDKVVKMILQYKTKQGINNALMKEFPSNNNKRASEIYTAIKPLLSDKKGNVAVPEKTAEPERAEMPQSRFEKQSEIFESILMKSDNLPAGPVRIPERREEPKKADAPRQEQRQEPQKRAEEVKKADAPQQETPKHAEEPKKTKNAKRSEKAKKAAKKQEKKSEEKTPEKTAAEAVAVQEEKSIEKPVEHTEETPAAASVEKSLEKPAENATENTEAQPYDPASEKTAEKSEKQPEASGQSENSDITEKAGQAANSDKPQKAKRSYTRRKTASRKAETSGTDEKAVEISADVKPAESTAVKSAEKTSVSAEVTGQSSEETEKPKRTRTRRKTKAAEKPAKEEGSTPAKEEA